MAENKVAQIIITAQGNKKFRQAVTDAIYKIVMADDFIKETVKPGCELTFSSTIQPSEEE